MLESLFKQFKFEVSDDFANHIGGGVVPKAQCVAMYASFAMLFTLATYRALWLLSLSSQAGISGDSNQAASTFSDAGGNRETKTLLKQLQNEETLLALGKRFLIRRSFHFVLLAIVIQSQLCPSIIGALFLAASGACMLAFGVATGTQPVTASVVAAVASAMWAMLQYVVCSKWLQVSLHAAHAHSSMHVGLEVLGLPALQV